MEHDITLTVNGTEEELTVDSRTLLVHALRDELGYTGPNVGCETTLCGACTVELDGEVVKSCTVLAVQADGSEVRTVAGLDEGTFEPIRRAFTEEHGLQCGYCTPGMVISTAELLDAEPDPDREEIRTALKGNLCRCTGYRPIVDAVEKAADDLGDERVETDGGTADTDGGTGDGDEGRSGVREREGDD